MKHNLLICEEERKIVNYAKALLIKSGLEFKDLPAIPDGAWTLFGPPTRDEIEAFSQEYDLGAGKPPEKAEALDILCELREFGEKIERWICDLNKENIFISPLVHNASILPSWLSSYKGNHINSDEEAAWAVVEKWSRVEEREEDLDRWLDQSAALTKRVGELLGNEAIVIGSREDCLPELRRHRNTDSSMMQHAG